MDLITRTPVLTGAQLGGRIVSPPVAALALFAEPVDAWTSITLALSLFPPLRDLPRQLPPSLLTEMTVEPPPA